MGLRTWAVGLAVIGSGAGAVLAPPALVRAALADRAIRVDRVSWSAAGLRIQGIHGEGVEAEGATVAWDRRIHLERVTVDGARVLKQLASEIPSPPGSDRGGAPPALATLIAAVDVDRLDVVGVPLPYLWSGGEPPPLSGSLLPTRHLTGEGIRIDDDHVTATIPTAWGSVTAQAQPGPAGVVVTVNAPSLTLHHAELGPEALVVEHVTADGVWADGRFTGEVHAAGVGATVQASVSDGTVHAALAVDRADLADVYALLGALVPEAARARIGGTLTASLTVDGPLTSDPSTLDLHIEPSLQGFTVRGLIPDRYGGGTFRYPTRDLAGDPTFRTAGEGTADWAPLDSLGVWLPAAVVASEDGGFWSHAGYDLQGILAAAADNEARGETWRGGSTLTQQLAKNLFLDGTRTYTRKARELLYAVGLEQSLGKHRIMELYLNVVEWGPGIYGAKHAAATYFLKQPAGLLPEEAAWLASVLPGPRSAYTRQYLGNRPHMERVREILAKMGRRADASGAHGAPADTAAIEAAKLRTVRFVPP